MGRLGETIGRQRAAAARAADPPAGPPAAAPPAAQAERANGSQLARRRDTLTAQVTELHWDLGGLAYEMAIRDHFRLDVLMGRAAVLQERDAELAEVERLLRMEEDGSAGNCANCGAPHSRGAVFCWQCGAGLMERLSSAAPAGANAADATLATLLAAGPDTGRTDGASG
jgi:hypothetical protein